jgi:hypothetical protein
MMLKIEYQILLPSGDMLTEQSLQSLRYLYEDLFDSYGFCEGAIHISDDAGFDMLIEDELPALIKNLCFEANAEEQLTGRGIYYYVSDVSRLYLTREGEKVSVSSNREFISTFNRDEWSTRLGDCGKRYIQLLRTIGNRDETRVAERESLISLLEISKNILETETRS